MKLQHKVVAVILAFLAITWLLPPDFNLGRIGNNTALAEAGTSRNKAAVAAADKANSADSNNRMNGYALDSSNIVGEIVNKRDKFVKQFKMADGTTQAVIYSSAVNYKKTDGTWAEIDNSLLQTKDKAGNSIFKTKDNGYMNVSFANNSKSDKLVSVTKDKYSIGWKLDKTVGLPKKGVTPDETKAIEATKSPAVKPSVEPTHPESTATETDTSKVDSTTGKISGNASLIATDTPVVTDTPVATDSSVITSTPEATEVSSSPSPTAQITDNGDNINSVMPSIIDDYAGKKASLKGNALQRFDSKVSSHILYSDVAGDVSLDYIVEPERIKESVTLASYIPNFSISFDISADGLTTKSLDGGITAFCDGNKEVFYLMPSSAFDNQDDEGHVNTTLEPIQGGYKLTITPDDTWLSTAVYPVVVDPQINTDWNPSNINNTYISSKYHNGVNNNGNNGPWYTYGDIRLGYSDSYDTSYGLVKYVNLPLLTSSQAVVGAYMISERSDDYTSSGYQFTIHNIKKDWSQTQVTWDNFINSSGQAFDPTIEETHIIDNTHGTNGSFYTWDITNLMREWYTGVIPNYGFLIKGETTNNGYRKLWAANAKYVSDQVQTIIQYVNTAGLEGSWSYQSMDARRAGTASVNLFTGNLVVSRSDIGTSGNRMPVSISHVYNAVYKDDPDIGYGMGWRLNYSQTIVGEVISGVQYYDYTDEDGTVHYFRYDSATSKYIDESGQNRTFAINTGSTGARYTITDKDDNVMTFDFVDMPGTTPDFGRLVKISDCIGNYISITYSGTTKKITSIMDGARTNDVGRTYSFSYYNNGAGDLQTITAPGSRTVGFTYDASNRLVNVADPDDNQSTYVYNTTATKLNNALTQMRNYDGYYLAMIYNTQDFMFPKVSEIDEYSVDQSNNLVQGGSQSFTYNEKETKVEDQLHNINIYQFNQYGNTVTIQDDKGRAVYSQYYNPTAATSDSGTYGQNKMSLSSRLEEPVMNYAPDSSFEIGSSWQTYSYNGGGSIGRDTPTAYIGSYSGKINNTNTQGYNLLYQFINVPKGNTYTYSSWVKTDNLVGSGWYGAVLQVVYWDSSNTAHYVPSQILTGSNDWTRVDVQFTVPADAYTSQIQIEFVNIYDTGTAWFDGVQLEKHEVSNRYNLVQNGDMTYSTSGTPNFWTKNGCTASDISTTTSDPDRGLLDNNVFTIVGSMATDKSISQTIMVSGALGDSFSFGGWGKATAAPLGTAYKNNISYGRQFGIRVQLLSGTTDEGTVTVPFNDFSNLWQYLSGRVVAKGAYDRAVITVLYENEVNTAWFDGIELYKEEFGQAYDYDKNGNIITAKDLSDQKSGVTYDANNNPTSLQPPDCTGNDKYTATYLTGNQKHLVDTATTVMGVKSKYTYDGNGNTLSSETRDNLANPTAFIRSQAEYTANGNYISKSYDARGNYSQYNYDSNYGVNLSTTDPSLQSVNYTYDSNNSAIKMGKLTGVSATVGTTLYTNSYGYTNDFLTTITHNDFDYTIGYNPFGQTTTVAVGTQNLVTNTYITSDKSYLLDHITYGNNGSVHYAYDDRYRVKGISYDADSAARYAYTYAANGQLGSMRDNQNNMTTNLYYDLANRPMKTTEKYDSGTKRSFQYKYDMDNCLTQFLELFNTTSYKTDLMYDKDNRITSVNYNGTDAQPENTRNVRYAYDVLGRLSTRTLETGASDYTLTYNYLAGGYGTGSTTGMISSINYNGASSLAYTYDSCGRILTVNDGTNTIHYTYDGLGQLLRTDDPTDTSGDATGSTWVYAYDKGGNITSKTLYAFAYGNNNLSDNDVVHNYPYAYDTAWKDKLMSYDGNAISYDNIGNPTNDGTWAYTWEAGRQLQQMSNGTTTLQFKYNEAGLRTQKINGSTTTKYYWNGSTLSDLTNGQATLHFWYDASGMPTMVQYNGTSYYYIRNVQNDIIGLLNSSGTAVVSYIYDTWGKPISITGSESSTIGQLNPFRYRSYIYDNETGLYYLQHRYYDPELSRMISADSQLNPQRGSLGANLYIYCGNNPVNNSDPDGFFWNEIWNFVKNTAKAVANFFSPSTDTVSTKVQSGLFRASGSATAGYSDFNTRLQVNATAKDNVPGWLGCYGKASVANGTGRVGIGNDKINANLKGTGDLLTATAQAGIQYKNGLGLAAKAKASVATGIATAEFNISGWSVELGVSGDLLSVGAEAMVGMFPDEGFTAKASVGAGLVGAGFVIRIKPPQ